MVSISCIGRAHKYFQERKFPNVGIGGACSWDHAENLQVFRFIYKKKSWVPAAVQEYISDKATQNELRIEK
jgi:hypothetical protein